MAKRGNTGVLDAALNVIKTGISGLGPCDKITACSAEPTTYAEGNATYALAGVAMSGSDFTLGNGDGSGNTPRKVTTTQKIGVAIDSSGTATHIAWLDTANSVLLAVTTCTSQALTAGGTVTIPAHKMELGAPA